jgi:hypothetical protein
MAVPQSARYAGSEPDGRTTSHPSRSERDYGATGREPGPPARGEPNAPKKRIYPTESD